LGLFDDEDETPKETAKTAAQVLMAAQLQQAAQRK
jgi:hypothetical protein